MFFKKVVYRDSELEGERLELTDKGSLYFLGPDVMLRNCTLVVKVSARNLLIREKTRIIDCTCDVRQELKNHQDWVFASLKNCRFKGRLSGCDFGHWPDYAPGCGQGAIEDCDFSEAQLDGCRFMGGDPGTLKFPKWPCFTILDPIQRAPELRSVTWPGLFGSVVIDELHKRPRPTRAVTYHAPSLAKRYETTPEAIKAVVERFDCIVF